MYIYIYLYVQLKHFVYSRNEQSIVNQLYFKKKYLITEGSFHHAIDFFLRRILWKIEKPIFQAVKSIKQLQVKGPPPRLMGAVSCRPGSSHLCVGEAR